MASTTGTPVSVTITVKIGDNAETFDALAAGTDPYSVARGLLHALGDDADRWVGNRCHDARHGLAR